LLLFESRPANGDELEKLLRRPLSPGSIVLLTKYPADPRVAERLTLALRSRDAATRGVAARVVNLAALRAILPAVVTALSAESDPEAAKEEVRTLISLGGPTHDETVLAAARRLAPALDRELVRMVARLRGPQVISLYFSTLRSLALAPSDREAFFRLATREQADHLLGASARAFGSKDSAAWQAILNVAGDLGLKLDEPVFVEALRSRDTVFRGEAAWYLARAHCESSPANSEEILAAISGPEAAAPGDDPELRFGAEMLRRVLGRPAVEDVAWIACLESNPDCHLDSDFEVSPLLSFLTPREREAIERRNGRALPQEAKSAAEKPAPLPREKGLRLVTGLPKGIVRDLFERERCGGSVRSGAFSVAVLRFRGDGLPSSVLLQEAPQRTSCRRAAESLFLMALAPEDEYVPSESARTYVVPLASAEMLCNEGSSYSQSASAGPDGIVRVRAKVEPPRLLKKIKPIYPMAAWQYHEQGISIYEAIITPAGCIRDLKLLRSSTPLLDVAGILAISQWRYRPATLDGRPVSVYLTVTVTYSL
jgi:hypothetical protein